MFEALKSAWKLVNDKLPEHGKKLECGHDCTLLTSHSRLV